MNKILPIIAGCLLAAPVFAGTANFDSDKPGEAPTGWQVSITGKGESNYAVTADASAPSQSNALKQSGIAARSGFPLCVKGERALEDGYVEVKFKPLTGKIDQAGGVVWRYTDESNYYVCRANALEDNVVLYKVEKGKRSSLDIVGRKDGYGVDVKVPRGEWSTLRVDFKGTRFTVSLNGKELFRVDDATFTEAGRVGMWTKADSVTLFDDFSYGGM